MFQYNHNKHYTDLLMLQVPPRCQHALDIGCGDGSLVRHLAGRFPMQVTGIEPDRAMIERARTATNDQAVQFIEADFMDYQFEEQFDFITAVASLHHLPFEPALEKMASLLRPDGVLAILGLFRETGMTDLTLALAATPVNAFYALTRGWSYSGAPTRPANLSLQEIRNGASSILPGASLRRLLLWRYLLTWKKPLS